MNRIIRHSLFWISYLMLQSYIEFAWISHSFSSVPPWERFLMALSEETLQLFIKIPLVYLSFYIINQFAILNRQYLKAIISLIGLVIIALIAHRFLIIKILLPYIYLDNSVEEPFKVTRIISSFIDLVFLIGIANALKQFSSRLTMKEHEKNLIREKLEAELNLLKAQTNPHFLFNTLNNIYALARKNSDKTSDVVMKLSKLLRFMLYESAKSRIPVTQEIKLIEDYLDLERIRYNERLKLKFTYNNDKSTDEITPLILLPLIENAFKHGASESTIDSSIDIQLSIRNGVLNFSVLNSKDENAGTATENFGLKSIRRQLELLYKDYNLQINDEKHSFMVHLVIDLNSYVEL